MCNDYEQHVAWADYRRIMQELELGMPTEASDRDLPQADDIRINDRGPVMRAAGNVVELGPMTFGLPPKGARGGPVFNFKSEGRRFANSNRCLIPASAFFEFTGKRYPKAKHRFSLAGASFMAIAGLWREIQGSEVPAFTMLTVAPGEDVEPYHDRQVAVLRPEDWGALALPDQARARASSPPAQGVPARRDGARRERLEPKFSCRRRESVTTVQKARR